MTAFYTAWVDPSETTFDVSHEVADLDVFSFELSQSEGDFASLDLDILNPKVGLLNAGRKQWLWFAYDDGATVTPLFFGRLIGIPQELQNEVVRLKFVARPVDFESQKEVVGEALRVAPYWDALFVQEDRWTDPDAALEARPQLWHIDPVTHVVTAANIIVGDDGTETINNHFYPSLKVSYQTPPAKTCRVEATVKWHQRATGVIDITDELTAFKTHTGPGMFDSWPRKGDSFGTVWSVETTSPGSQEAFIYYSQTENGYEFDDEFGSYQPLYGFVTSGGSSAMIREWTFAPEMSVRYSVDRQFSEKLIINLIADVQPMVTDETTQSTIQVSVAGDADIAVDPPAGGASGGSSGGSSYAGYTTPILDRAGRRYYATERGQQSIGYLLALARARLLFRSRAVNITADVPFDDAMTFSLRKSATITDDRLPGGSATGKIIATSLKGSGDSGELIGSVEIACTVGNGGTISPAAGTPTYVELDYVGTPYQAYTGNQIEPISGEIVYNGLDEYVPADDGIEIGQMTPESIVEGVTVYFDSATQRTEAGIGGGGFVTGLADPQAVDDRINNAPTVYEVDLLDFAPGPFETEISLTTSSLKIVKTIDLGAA